MISQDLFSSTATYRHDYEGRGSKSYPSEIERVLNEIHDIP